MTAHRIWIPPRTPLLAVWRFEHDKCWRVFTAMPNPAETECHKLVGTMLAMHDSGEAYREVWRPDDVNSDKWRVFP